jgi:hypothetical protein
MDRGGGAAAPWRRERGDVGAAAAARRRPAAAVALAATAATGTWQKPFQPCGPGILPYPSCAGTAGLQWRPWMPPRPHPIPSPRRCGTQRSPCRRPSPPSPAQPSPPRGTSGRRRRPRAAGAQPWAGLTTGSLQWRRGSRSPSIFGAPRSVPRATRSTPSRAAGNASWGTSRRTPPPARGPLAWRPTAAARRRPRRRRARSGSGWMGSSTGRYALGRRGVGLAAPGRQPKAPRLPGCRASGHPQLPRTPRAPGAAHPARPTPPPSPPPLTRLPAGVRQGVEGARLQGGHFQVRGRGHFMGEEDGGQGGAQAVHRPEESCGRVAALQAQGRRMWGGSRACFKGWPRAWGRVCACRAGAR